MTEANIVGMRPHASLILPGTLRGMARFVVARHFFVGAVVGGRPIARLGGEFKRYPGRRVEKNVPEIRALQSWDLAINGEIGTFLTRKQDFPISSLMRLLGGKGKAYLYLAHVLQIMERGEEGCAFVKPSEKFQDELLVSWDRTAAGWSAYSVAFSLLLRVNPSSPEGSYRLFSG